MAACNEESGIQKLLSDKNYLSNFTEVQDPLTAEESEAVSLASSDPESVAADLEGSDPEQRFFLMAVLEHAGKLDAHTSWLDRVIYSVEGYLRDTQRGAGPVASGERHVNRLERMPTSMVTLEEIRRNPGGFVHMFSGRFEQSAEKLQRVADQIIAKLQKRVAVSAKQ